MEAIGSQVSLLRAHFPGSVAWGLHPHRKCQLSRRNGFILHPAAWPLFRGATAVLQRRFDVNHIVGSLGDWYYLRAAIRRPIIVTAAVRTTHSDVSLLEKVDRFVVEWPSDVSHLTALRVDPIQIQIIPPPVDLERFKPSLPPTGAFSVLFASSPDAADWLMDRGLDVLLEAAALRPQYEFQLVWRPWGDSYQTIKKWVAERELRNVEIIVGSFSRMELLFQRAHATIAPFKNPNTTKSVPNSLVESLACGRPVVTTPIVGIGDAVQTSRAGRCVAPSGPVLAESLDDIQQNWDHMSRNARRFAEIHFSKAQFLRSYDELYGSVLAKAGARGCSATQHT